ncbi:MAG: 8-oxoguanine DNA glycosylase, N-terminal domain-containing protein, partial [Neofamilia sp.]
MEININENKIILQGQDSFEPEHIFECGQAFRWDREADGSYTVVAHERVINVSSFGKDVIIKNTNIEDFEKIWKNYFDLETDYIKIQNTFNKDEIMQEAIEYGKGIRVLNQEPFET